MAISIEMYPSTGQRLEIDNKQSFTKILQNTISLLKSSQKRSWEKIKAVMQEFQFQYFPPNLDFRGSDEANLGGGTGGKMKQAVGKSFDKSKETVEGTAKSAAEVVGKTMDKTTKKVKKSVFEEESDAEL
ncbi:hypothetical protein TorRG33x02_185260 [Trema orientale]|uniref:Uncharacterized protein n=1 Tax=Trema orientale TaxID=63057 RepID=A0A2P5EJE0_TREOI|nr:hypothetical protein TorRG33x02_185260 [Trema orientale]